MINEKNGDMIFIICLVVAVILIIIAIWTIICLLIENKKENEKASEMIHNNAVPAVEGPYSEELAENLRSNYGSAYTDEKDLSKGYYSSVRHFTDTGRAYTHSKGNSIGSNTVAGNFVIIKSVIYTETREEIEQVI